MRSFKELMPEEINRIVTDRVSDLLFCPTETAIRNLQAEGFDSMDKEIVSTGDVMYDAALFYADRAVSPFKPGKEPGEFVLATQARLLWSGCLPGSSAFFILR